MWCGWSRGAALSTAATAGGLNVEQSSGEKWAGTSVIVGGSSGGNVKYTVVARLTLDKVNWLEVLGIMLAIIISLHTMKLIVPTKFTKNIIDIVLLRIPEVSIMAGSRWLSLLLHELWHSLHISSESGNCP